MEGVVWIPEPSMPVSLRQISHYIRSHRMTLPRLALTTGVLLILGLGFACGDDDPVGPAPTPPARDTTPPGSVTDLAVTANTDTSATLTWTAPGNDGAQGTATEYDIRYSTSLIDSANFDAAAQPAFVPAPDTAGTTETLTIQGLMESTTYHFAIKAADSVPNWSGLSNVPSVTTAAALPPAPQFVRKWGTYGSGDGQMIWPRGIALDGSGNVYVVDWGNDRIQKFSTAGVFERTWPSGKAVDVAVDAAGNVYAIINNWVEKYTPTGTYITGWTVYPGAIAYYQGIAVRGSSVYVMGYSEVRSFDLNGNPQSTFGTYGTGDGEFDGVTDIAWDSGGNFYIVDLGNHRIQKFNAAGAFLTKWGVEGSSYGEFQNPASIAVDASDNVYVTDTNDDRIQVFDTAGNFITTWGRGGSLDGRFNGPMDIDIDAAGEIYVTDMSNWRVQVFK
jgi:hypothetical protein